MAEVVIPLIIAAVGTAVNVRNNRKAAVERRKADKLNRRQTDLENQRRIRLAVAQARVNRAKALASASGAGVDTSSSSIQGAIGSAQTQLGANIGFAQQTADANARANKFIASSNSALNRAQTFQAIGNLPTQFGFSPGAVVRGAVRDKGTQPEVGIGIPSK